MSEVMLKADHEAAEKYAKQLIEWFGTDTWLATKQGNVARAYLEARAMQGDGAALRAALAEIVERFDIADNGATAILSDELITRARAAIKES